MTTRDTPFAPGTPCWVDLLTSDPDKARAFYGELFGWSADEGDEEFGGYVNFMSDGHGVGGMMRNSEDIPAPDGWTTYISTADIEATAAAVAEEGGQMIQRPMQVGDFGSMAIVSDPVGAVFGLWQAGSHTGFGRYNEPGSVTWDEHHSKDFATSTRFYSSVFGWEFDKASDTDDFRYYTAKVDGETVAGLMDSAGFLPAEVPSHWSVYFSVADIDASVQKVVGLGGSVVRPAEDTPFGRIADLRDPTGAPFKLHQVLPDAS